MKRSISLLLALVLLFTMALPVSAAQQEESLPTEHQTQELPPETPQPEIPEEEPTPSTQPEETPAPTESPEPEQEPSTPAQPEQVEEAHYSAGKKLAAITYDDGPGPYTNQLLDGLKTRGAKATFFMVGQNAAQYPSIVERVYQEGHQVANHSYDHSNLANLSAYGVQSQIQRTNEVLDRACGKGTKYMVRLPYGSGTATTLQAVGAPLAMWAVDPQDWLYRNSDTVHSRIISSTSDGDIILVHDIHATSIPGSLAAIDTLQARGYEFVTVNELFRRRGKSLINGVQVNSCAPNGTDLGPVKAPTITATPEDGKLRVTITAQEGASIYYSTNGSSINQTSTRYTGPFLVSPPCTIKAVAAFNLNGSRSETVTKSLTMPVAAVPRINVEEGVMTLTCSTPDAVLHYTLNGEAFTYSGPVELTPGTEITAYAGKEGWLNSTQTRASYSSRGNFFRDVLGGQWYYEYMDRAVSAGYLSGIGDSRYLPNGQVTRGQLAVMLMQWAGESPEEGAVERLPFPDVKPGKYYAKAVAWAYENGIVSGTNTGKFYPEWGVSRQEMCIMIANLLKSRGETLPDGSGVANWYADSGEIANWALSAVEQMTVLGLFAGDDKGAFRPAEKSTRAQAATVLMALADKYSPQDEG